MAGSSASFTYWYPITSGTVGAANSLSMTLTDFIGGGNSSATLGSEPVTWSKTGNSVTITKYHSGTGDVQIDDVGTKYLLSNNGGRSGAVTSLVNNSTGPYPYCFLAGTQIATPHGAVAVETLKVGDEVITHNGSLRQAQGTAKVRFNFVQKYHNHFFINKEDTYPICIQANALADNVPSRDLYVTADHAIYFPEWNFFVEASILAVIVNDTSIYPVQHMPETFTYYHILCDNQEIVLAENTPAETFIDNVSMETFDNYAEYAALYPEEHVMEEIDIPRGRSERPLPRAFKQNLLERAQRLYPVAQAA